MSIFENVIYGGQVTLIGLLVVFFGLALLIVLINIMLWAFKKFGGKNEAVEQTAAPAVQSVPAPPAPPAPPAEPAQVQDAELIAVIAAAIAAYDNSGKRLIVRRVRRISGWNRTAREEQVYRF